MKRKLEKMPIKLENEEIKDEFLIISDNEKFLANNLPINRVKTCRLSLKNSNLCAKENKFKCEYCDRKYSQKCDLKKHIRVHTGETHYKCEYCVKIFENSSNLKMHVRVHTNERPYKCEYCNKKFKTNGCLKDHIIIHTNERIEFKCGYCDKKFKRNISLKNHIKIHATENKIMPKNNFCNFQKLK